MLHPSLCTQPGRAPAAPPFCARSIAVLGMRLLPKGVFVQRHQAFIGKVLHSLEEWEAFPARRPFIEQVLRARFADRVRRRAGAGASCWGGACLRF